MISFLTSLNIAGLMLALLFILILLSKKNKKIADYLLIFFIFLLGSFLLIKYAFQNDLFNTYPIIIYMDIYYWVLLGPTLYVYTLVSTTENNQLHIKYLYTLIPAVLVTIFFSKYIFRTPTLFFANEQEVSLFAQIGLYIWLGNSPIFYILTIIAIKKHQKRIKNLFSFSKSIDLNWLNYLTHGFALFIFFLLFRIPISYIFNWDFPFDNYGISLIIVFLYIFGIGFYGYKQRGIFDVDFSHNPEALGEPILKKVNLGEEKKHLAYKKSGLDKEEALVIQEKLKNLMLNEEPYLESELNLNLLAIKTKVSTHKLSQVINEYLDKNFFDYINEYRIEKVKEFLADPNYNHLKIVSLAYDSGFSSKSTFYTLFRKLEGITPNEYRKKQQLLVV